MKITRKFGGPNRNTFTIKPIREFLEEHMKKDEFWIDPFANESSIANVTNDLNPKFKTDYHLAAEDFMKIFEDNSVDGVLFDPPYSPTQVKQCYEGIGLGVSLHETQATFWSRIRDEIQRVLKPGGKAICFGWNTNGCGKSRGFELEEVLIVPHGGVHHDTLVTLERKK